MITEDDKQLVFVPLEEASTPPGGIIECLKDNFWLYKEGKGILYWKDKYNSYPQCNINRAVVENIKNRMYPWAEIIYVPVVFMKINIKDYT